MSLTIIKAGLLDTIQDMGRKGYANWGINPGGAMDRYAASIANYLVGNDCHEAVLEMHFPPAQVLFEQTALVALTGADFSAVINDKPFPLWQPVLVRKNTILHFSQLGSGARAYLSVHGGFAIPYWLNSYSTNIKAGTGGFKGRKLEKGDEIHFGESRIYYAGLLKPESDYQPLPWKADYGKTYHLPESVLMTKGKEWDQLAEQSRSVMISEALQIHPSSDRMGYTLTGGSIHLDNPFELLSSGVAFGTIQLLPSGQLILLMADHQTTGGYPRIGHVVSAHLPKVAQLGPGDTIRFELTDINTAEQMFFNQQQELQIIKRGCMDHLNHFLCTL